MSIPSRPLAPWVPAPYLADNEQGDGEPPVRMVLSNAGDHLHIDEPNAAVSVR